MPDKCRVDVIMTVDDVTVDEEMVDLLVANDKEVVFTACGVLIHLMSDDDRRSMFRKHGGVTK